MRRTFILAAILAFFLLPLAAQTITTVSPNGGENWVIGSTVAITWNSSGVATVRLILYKGGTTADYRIGVIANGLQAASGSYLWPVGTYIGGTVNAGNDYYIRVRSESDATEDVSDAPFTLSNPPPSSLTLVLPNGGESWDKGSDRSISWTASNMTANCRLLLLKDGQVLGTIKDNLSPGNGSGAIPWKAGEYIGGSASVFGSGYKVRIESVNGQYSDSSDNAFSITAPPLIFHPVDRPQLGKLTLLPDLIVCLNWHGEIPNIYQHRRVYVHVRNIGLANSTPTLFKIYVEGHGTLTLLAPWLPPNGEYSWSQLFNWKTCGHKTVRATVDPDGQLTESNENNNVVESSIKVSCGEAGYLLEMVDCSDPNQHY